MRLVVLKAFDKIIRRNISLKALTSAVICVSVATLSSYAFAEASVIRIGVLAYRGESQAMQSWAPMGQYLESSLPNSEVVIVPYDLSQLRAAVKSRQVDFVITQATQYVSMEVNYGVSRIATIKREYQGQDYTNIGAVIITRAERDDIYALADLQEKSFAAVNESAFGGWQMAAGTLNRENITLGSVTYVGYPHSNVVFAVRDGLADAGTMRARAFFALVDSGVIDIHDFKILGSRTTEGYPYVHSTDLYPEWPIAKLSHVREALAESVVGALLALEKSHVAARAAGISGWTVPLDYKSIHMLMQQLGVEPYNQKPRNNSSSDQVFTNTFWIVVIGLLMLIAIVAIFWQQYMARFQMRQLRSEIEDVCSENIAFELYAQRALSALSVINNAVMILDQHGKIVYLNNYAKSLLGLQDDEVLGKSPGDLIIFDSGYEDLESRLVENPFEKNSDATANFTGTFTNRNGQQYHIELNTQFVKNDNGDWLGTVMVLKDNTTTRQMERKIIYQASHDALTGLMNRRAFEAKLQLALQQIGMKGFECCVIYMDLDQFKLVNDSCGHIAGDELLKQVAEIILECTKAGEQIARIGSDEFAILLDTCNGSQALQIAERIRENINQYRFIWDDKLFDITASLGIVLLTEQYQTIADILGDADAACFAAKYHGGNRVFVYSGEDKVIQKRRDEVQWTHEIKYALDNDKFELASQAILSLDEQKAHSYYLEILVRMRNRQDELVNPGSFIPAAERYYQMPVIDRWVVERTVSSLVKAGLSNSKNIRCFVNISGQTISDVGFLNFVRNLINTTGINPGCLCFEITETATIANFKFAAQLMSELQKIGCHFALDDFGTGLSSFAYLKQLPVNYIKIDGSFIKKMADDEVARAIVDAISSICHTMKIEAIAEFVESESILENVKMVSLDYAQGNIVDKPQPLTETLNRIKKELQILEKTVN